MSLEDIQGSRKLYIITVEKGNDITDSKIPLQNAIDFINSNVSKNVRRDLFERMKKYTKNEMVDADVFNNLILNGKGLKGSKTSNLRQFLIDNNIDYEIVHNAFGFGEKMMVLYNMKKIVNVYRFKSGDTLDNWDL